MPTYLMLATLTPDGVQTVKNNPQRIKEVNREVEQLGATVKAQWSTLRRFDFVSIVEAPDELTMSRVSLELGIPIAPTSTDLASVCAEEIDLQRVAWPANVIELKSDGQRYEVIVTLGPANPLPAAE